VRLSRRSRARTHPAAENQTLRRRAGALRECQAQKKNTSGQVSAEGEAASGDSRRKGLALFCASPSTSARSAGSFEG